ncbi:MAG: TrkA family potassium uptake protein [Sphingopyxis sp.]|nr:TrkA family potassium uptake protein [Sphingopyxis sp.]
MAKNGTREYIAVVGLGRFGSAVAETLHSHGHEVLAIDLDGDRVQALSGVLPHLVQADCTNVDVVRNLGLADADHAVVAIGNNLEASVMTVMSLHEAGVRDIWAKAMSARHGEILTRVGATHISYPEVDQGRRVAHLIDGQMSDFLAMSDGFAVAVTRVPAEAAGKPLGELGMRRRLGITVIAIKRAGEELEYATPETRLVVGEQILISGQSDKVRAFSDRVVIE